ncbi:Signal transduction histidine kinase [Lentzea xinjiangensis]|uniref:histidine kinase n=1 Tax=Lentzea xinjiangensis TaxID=402600 RepID=A0A1H9FZ29_9PSEU|nr:histidine kinase [Lentzea xinjiangensis]SEQ43107.1 Signal transduction histidine kinase [Lentzea xinjiangensis]
MRFVWPLIAFLAGLTPLLAPLAPVPHWSLTVLTALWVAGLVWLAPRRPEWSLLLTAPLFAVNNLWAQAATVFVVFTAARRVPRLGRLWALLGAMTLLQTAFSLAQQSNRELPLQEALFGAVTGSVFFVLFPAVSGMLLGRRRPMVRLLQERNEYLERARALTAASARSEERAHIAGEMHDMLGHRLSLISIHAGALELATATKAPQLHEQAELIRTTSSLAMAELREILGVLRTNPEPESLDEDTGTRSDITALVESSVQAGISATLDWSGDDLHGADPRTRRAVHRVVREALTNVHKHAPRARTRVQVAVQGGRARVQVLNGPSSGAPGKGTRRGLIGLEERVGLLGGSFSAGAPVEGGFRVAADVPLHPAAQAEQSATDVREVPPPLAAEVLTVPRVLGGGCLGLLALVPISGALIVLLVLALLSPSQMNAPYFDSMRVGVTTEDEVMDQFGIGQPGADGCSRYRASHNAELLYKVCFRDGKLSSKEQERP